MGWQSEPLVWASDAPPWKGDTELSGVNFQGANLAGANFNMVNLSQADFREADLSGATLTYATLSHLDLRQTTLSDAMGLYMFELGAPPLWPKLSTSEMHQMQEEATNPATAPTRLTTLAISWPGYLVWEALASNPNLPQELILALGRYYPHAFFTNPAIPLLFGENPQWLKREEAAELLSGWEAIPGEHSWEVANPELLRLMRAIAKKG